MNWLNVIAAFSLIAAAVCAVVIVFDLREHPQNMWIMNLVWPLTALYAGPLALWGYFRVGKLSSRENFERAKKQNQKAPGSKKPFWQSVGLAATHCGSGCTLGDICAEWLIFFVPLTLLGERIFGAWAVDYVFALLFGIAFQYFTIKPMRDVSVIEALKAAIKADVLSLTSWQIGMYGWMATTVFVIFGHELPKTTPLFWFMMQVAMVAGFLTSYPVNWWLLRKGIKEVM